MRIRLLVLLLPFFFATALMAQSHMGGGMPNSMSSIPASAEDTAPTPAQLKASERVVVANYCRADFTGARLESKGWSRIRPYTTMDSNPGFTRIVIVSRYSIEPPIEESDVWIVDYQTVGYYLTGAGYNPATTSERAEIMINRDKERQKPFVASVRPQDPFVSPRSAIAWMQARLGDSSTDDGERKHLQDAIAELSKLLPLPAAAPSAAAPASSPAPAK